MPVTTVTVFHTVTDERGQPIAGVPVRIRLARHRFVRTQQLEILQWGVTTQTDANGYWSVPLVPNSLTDDPQSFYIVEEGQEGTPVYHVHYIRVPEGVTSVWLGDIVLHDLSGEPSLAPVFANVVQSLRAQGQAFLKGHVILKAGTNVTLVQDNTEKSIEIRSIHTHPPSDITPQGHGSGLDADTVDSVHAENLRIATIELTVGDGVNAITTGFKGAIYVPFSGQITEWAILSMDANPPTSGSIEIDILKSTYADYPTMSSMVGTGTKPNIANSNKGQGSPTGWATTAVNAGECIGFNVTSVSSLKRITIVLKVVKS